MSGIAYHHRVVAVGMNRSGKSELLRYVFASVRVRRVLIDPKGEWTVRGAAPAQLTAEDPDTARAQVAAIDWHAPIVHVQPAWHGRGDAAARAQLQAVYAAVAALPGPCTVWSDEAYGVSSASWCPPGLTSILVAGAALGKGHLAATQRPRHIARELLTEADHVFIVPPLGGDDLAYTVAESAPFLDKRHAARLVDGLPEHGYLYVDRRSSNVLIGDPLPRHMLEHQRQLIGKRPGLVEREPATAPTEPQPATEPTPAA